MPTTKRKPLSMVPSTYIPARKKNPEKKWTNKATKEWDSITKSLGGRKK